MKKRNNSYRSLMLVPPMVMMALIWSGNSHAFDTKSPLDDFFSARKLAVIEGDQETLVTRPEDIKEEDTKVEEQTPIEEVADAIVEETEGSFPKKTEEMDEGGLEIQEEDEEVVAEGEKENTDEVGQEKEDNKDLVACEKTEKKKSLAQEVKEQEKDIMQQYQDFFQAVMVPMMANYISTREFKAPPVQYGFTGIPAQNTNFGAGLGLNLLSLSDYYNAKSLGHGNMTVNNYNVTGDFYNGAYNGTTHSNQQNPYGMNKFNPMMSQQMFDSATTSPYNFNFGGMAVQDHSRFDQMNSQNVQTPILNSPVTTPITTGPAPAAQTLNHSLPHASNSSDTPLNMIKG